MTMHAKNYKEISKFVEMTYKILMFSFSGHGKHRNERQNHLAIPRSPTLITLLLVKKMF